MPKKTKGFTITTKLTPQDHKRLIALRDRSGLTVTAILAKALLEYMDLEDKLAANPGAFQALEPAEPIEPEGCTLFDVINDKRRGRTA